MEVDIPSTCKGIAEGAFAKCRSLKKVRINEGVEKIGRFSFVECEALIEVKIPSTIKVIDNCAFQKAKSLKKLSLFEGLRRIGDGTFDRCESLIEVDLPSTVEVIDTAAFQRCIGLKKLSMCRGLIAVGEKAFYGCESLIEVDIPSTLSIICVGTFFRCKRLVKVTMHPGLQHIQGQAFGKCESLKEVRVPWTVVFIDRGAFSTLCSLRCTGIDGFDNLALAIRWHTRLPNQVSMAYLARMYHSKPIDPILIPATNQKERQVLQQVKNEVDLLVKTGHLELIAEAELSDAAVWVYDGQEKIPRTVRRVKIAENVTKIPDEAFKSHEALEEVFISSCVKAIGNSAFEDCKILKSVQLQLGQFQAIGDRAFYGCKSLAATVTMIDRCIICMDNQKMHALVPCGHLAFCGKCALQPPSTPPKESVKCPICHQESSMVIQIYDL
eukprot:scaffold333_cov133-Cylindrotheca_fusiformis.AAC.58